MRGHDAGLGAVVLAVAALALPGCRAPEDRGGIPPEVAFVEWSPAAFERARAEGGKLVLLDLGAVWCHWCHVMEETTYADLAVRRLLDEHFIAVKVDQDARPDLANRYEDYGWPATIVFDASGNEIVKRRGYVPPGEMAALLRACVEDPTPGPSAVPEKKVALGDASSLGPALRDELLRSFLATYDPAEGGFGFVHKYLESDSIELCLALAFRGDHEAEAMARVTIGKERAHLVDPVWGGAYQYSHGGVWVNPHFEKIMPRQAGDLVAMSLAHAQWGDDGSLAGAREIVRYLRGFLLSPEGAFYASQDADVVPGEHAGGYFALGDGERRALGTPRVDRSLYARENGFAIRGLAAYVAASGDDAALAMAVRAAEWALSRRALPGGGFRHGDADAGGPYLGDTLAMGRAFLALHAVTAERCWLDAAAAAARFVADTFAVGGEAGFATARPSPKDVVAPLPQIDENAGVARFGALLARYTGSEEHRALSSRAMRYLATPEIARSRGGFAAGILLADLERSEDPPHVTVVGAKDDPRARALFRAAGRIPAESRRVEWWDPEEGPLPNPDTPLPDLGSPAAFVCANGACSSPLSSPEAVLAAVRRR